MKRAGIALIIILLAVLCSYKPTEAMSEGDTCIIIFIGYDGKTEVARAAVNYGEPYVANPLQDQPGVTFLGWYTQYGSKANFTRVTSHMIVYARCNVVQYQVSFFDSTGLMVGSSMVQHGRAAFPPSNLVTEKVEGLYKYVLVWNQDFSCVTSNMTVHGTRVKQLIPGNPYTDSKGIKYKAISPNEVRVVGSKKGKKITKLSIPSSTSLGGIKCTVVGISANAFSKCRKLKSVTIGGQITYISSKAFYKCDSLKKITIKSNKLVTVSGKAFTGIQKNAVFHVPSKMKGNYKKILKSGGISSKMKVK